MPPKPGMSAKRIAKELIEVNKELPDGIRCVRRQSFATREGSLARLTHARAVSTLTGSAEPA